MFDMARLCPPKSLIMKGLSKDPESASSERLQADGFDMVKRNLTERKSLIHGPKGVDA